MAVRLGTQRWINPAPFQAAAEMIVDAGRSTGAGIASLGAGIGQGLQSFGAKQERDQRRQDALTQQGIENDRASRAEDRMLKQSKLAASESILTAKKMNLDMTSKMHEALGTPESEAAMLRAQREFQDANNWYQVSVGNNAGVEGPGSTGMPVETKVTDYLGAGNGPVVNGKPMSQMTDAELDDVMRKSEAGDVDYSYRGGATRDMGQGVGGFSPRTSPGSEAAVAMASEAGPAPREMTDGDVLGAAVAEEERLRVLKDRHKGNSKYLNEWANANRKAEQLKLGYIRAEEDRKVAREAAAKASEAQATAKKQNAALRSAVNPETGRPYLSMAEPDLPDAAAALLYKQAEARYVEEGKFPTRKAMQDDRQDASAVENERKRTFTLDRMRQANEYSEGRIKLAAEQRRAAADEAREAGVPADQVNAIFKEIQAGHSEQRVLAARAQDLMNAGRVEEASALFDAAKMMDGDLNELMAQMRDARMKIGQPTTGGGITGESVEVRQAQVDAAFDALPKEQQTDEQMMKMLKAAGLAR